MKTLLILDYTAEVFHLCYLLLTALFRLTVKAAVFTYVLGQTVGNYYYSLTELSFRINLSSPAGASLRAYLGETRQLSHPLMIRS